MALVVKDRVRETTSTTGTGTVTLAGAVTGFQTFSAIGNGNTTYYTIAGQGTSEWEVGVGTYTASGTTLSRDSVLSSSNSGNLVNFSAGTKDVFCTYPAERSVDTESAETLNNKTITQRVSSTTSISSPLAWNSDNYDMYAATAQAGALTINADSGTPSDARKVIFRITCDATPRVITFTGGSSKSFKPIGVSLTASGSDYTYTLTASKTTYFGCIYSTNAARWDVVALSQE